MRAVAMYSALGGVVVVTAAAVVIGLNPDLLQTGLRRQPAPPPTPAAVATPAAPTASASPAAPVPATQAPRAEALPGFDIVRVERDGSAVIAGHASPGEKIELRDGDKVLGKVVADSSGQFVIVPDPLAAGPHALRLAALPATGEPRLSEPSAIDVAAGAPAAPAKPAVAVATPSSPLPQIAAAKPQVVAAPEAKTTPVLAALSPQPPVAAIPQPKPAASPVALPAPAPVSPAASRLAVARVKATEPGRLEAEGEADPGARLRLTLNGAFLAEVEAGVDGRWSLTIEHGMTPGLYALEANNLARPASPPARASFAYPQNPTPDAAPLVAAKPAELATLALPAKPLETPAPVPTTAEIVKAEPPPAPVAPAPSPSLAQIQPPPEAPKSAPAPSPVAAAQPAVTPKAAPAASVSAPLDPSHAVVAEVRTTTVVAGDNLWDLARKFYNDGTRYSDIYAANSGQIKNPSLIYIGQVFVVPQGAPVK